MNFFDDLLKKGNNDALDLPDVAEYRWKKPAENESEQGTGSDDVENGQPEEQVGQAPNNGATRTPTQRTVPEKPVDSEGGVADNRPQLGKIPNRWNIDVDEDELKRRIDAGLQKYERNESVRRAFGSQVSPEEMERVARPSVPTFDIGSFVPEDLGADTTPLDNIRGEQMVEQEPAGQLQQAVKLPELPDFQTWLAQQGGKYGDVGDVLGYDFKQAKQDYEDFVDPEAKARREKAAESRRRLAALGDIGLVIGDIVGAAAGGNVNRRGKSAGEVDYALRQAEENKALQREALLLQRYRQAADRGIANARQDYAQVMQRYLSDQQNALRQQALANDAKEIDYSHQQWLGEHELNVRKQAERERNNKILEDIAREKARVSGVRADAYASGINGLKKKFLENSFGVETTDPNTGAFVSKQTFGKHLGTMLKYTGIGSGGSSESNSISYKWAELGLEKEKNEGIYRSIKSMVDAGKELKDEKTPSTQQIQKYMSALVGLYNDVTSEGFMLRDKKGRDLPKETADFVNRVETNVIEVMRLVKLAERDNLNAYSNDVNALYMGEPLLETVDDALKK